MKKLYDLAVAGADSALGRKVIETLEKRDFPLSRLVLLGSGEKSILFKGQELPILALSGESVIKNRVDFALFCGENDESKRFAPLFTALGSTVIDSGAEFRLDENVPLVIASVNPEEALAAGGIIASPDGLSLAALSAIAPLGKKYGVKRIVYNTYREVFGCLEILPLAGEPLPGGYTANEQQLIDESRKLLGDSSLAVTATSACVPGGLGIGISANVELAYSVSDGDVVRTLSDAGIMLSPCPRLSDVLGQGKVFVSRIRRDFSHPNTFNLFITSDYLLYSALNLVRIAELFL